MLPSVALQIQIGAGLIAMDKRYANSNLIERYLIFQPCDWQWWDAVEQTNRPHGWAFSKIKGGVIRDMKLWKVRLKYTTLL